MGKHHHYAVEIDWTGDLGVGTAHYEAYARDHLIRVTGKPAIDGSSDPAFRGDPTRHNPEELFLASLSSCHMLWYLHLATTQGIVVTGYTDMAVATLNEGDAQRPGRFTEVVLRPQVLIGAGGDVEMARELHEAAHHACFLANSVNFPVLCEPTITISSV